MNTLADLIDKKTVELMYEATSYNIFMKNNPTINKCEYTFDDWISLPF